MSPKHQSSKGVKSSIVKNKINPTSAHNKYQSLTRDEEDYTMEVDVFKQINGFIRQALL